MPLDPRELYDLMECAYRNGLLGKLMVIQSQVLDAVMEEADVSFGDLLNHMDETGADTVMKMDKLLSRLGPFLKYLNNERMMRGISRLLDITIIRRVMAAGTKKVLLKPLVGKPSRSMGERMKAVLAKVA